MVFSPMDTFSFLRSRLEPKNPFHQENTKALIRNQ
jgi:hypothetical protein